MNLSLGVIRPLSALLVGSSALALAAPAMAQDQAGQCDPGDPECEEPGEPVPEENTIVVTGIRASIEGATNAKKNSDQIKDVIDAEDIGKLPDTNVAEALQRVTGVQVNRELGEGSEIAVRGFSQNRVEVNGQTQVGAGSTGNVTFEAVTSEAFKSIEVIKTPAADEVEGALGAIVRFNTRRPLDSRKNVTALKAEAQYAERAEAWTPNFNAFLSRRWDTASDAEFGVALTLTYKGRKLRQDFLDVRGWDAVNGFGDVNGDGEITRVMRDDNGVITDLGDGAYVPLQTRLQIREQDRDLYSGTLAFQVKPSSDVEVNIDASYTRSVASDTQFQYTSSFNSALQADGDGQQIRPVYQQPENAVISDDQTVLSALLGQVNSRNGTAQRGINLNIAGNSAPNERDVFTGAVSVDWDVTDRLNISGSYALGLGNQVNDQVFTSSGPQGNEWPFYLFDFGANTDIPTLVPLVREVDGQAVTEYREDLRLNLLELTTYRLGGGSVQRQFEENLDSAFRIDVDYELDAGPLTSLEFGGRLGKLTGARNRLRSDTLGTLEQTSFTDLEAMFPGLVVQQPYDQILDGATGDFPQEWFSLDSNYIRDNLEDLVDAAGVVRTPDLGWGFDVNLETQAAYVKANYDLALGGVDVFGNFGVRYVHTDQVATGGIDDGLNYVPQTVEQSYGNWLPSFNLVASLGDGFFARFGAARAISRPDLKDLSPFTNVQFFANAGEAGNPLLRPEEVDQFDVSLEKYYGDSNLISVALFYKNFNERIEDGVSQGCFVLPANIEESSPGDDGCPVGSDLIRLSLPVNAGAAKVKGLEVGWQQSLDFLPGLLSGFGFIANYTFVDADGGATSATGAILPVQDLSRHSYNLIGYYEKGPVQARLAYNWRSKFYDERTTTNQASFAEPYGQLDGSLSFELTKNFDLQFQALNILNEPEIRYQEIRERIVGYRVNDRRFLVGLSARM